MPETLWRASGDLLSCEKAIGPVERTLNLGAARLMHPMLL